MCVILKEFNISVLRQSVNHTLDVLRAIAIHNQNRIRSCNHCKVFNPNQNDFLSVRRSDEGSWGINSHCLTFRTNLSQSVEIADISPAHIGRRHNSDTALLRQRLCNSVVDRDLCELWPVGIQGLVEF